LSFESGLAGHANAVQQRLRIYTYIHHINVYGSDEEGSPEEHHRAVSAVSLDADTCSIQIARQSPDIDVLARHSAAFPLFGPSSVRNRFVFGMEPVGNRWGIAVEWKAMEWRARRAAFMLSLIFHTTSPFFLHLTATVFRYTTHRENTHTHPPMETTH